MEKNDYFSNIDRRTAKLIIEYSEKTLEEKNSLAIAKVMQGVAMEAIGAGVGLYEYDIETMHESLPHVGGIGLYSKAAVDKENSSVYPPVIYIVRNKMNKDNRIYCNPGFTDFELLIKFMKNSTFPIYELAVLAHEFGHHISSTINPTQCFKRDKAWARFVSLDTKHRTLDLIDRANLGWKTSRLLRKSAKKTYGKKRVTKEDKLLIYEEEKIAWCYGYKVLKRIVSRHGIKDAQVVFDFYTSCRNIALENYKRTIWPPRKTFRQLLCHLFQNTSFMLPWQPHMPRKITSKELPNG